MKKALSIILSVLVVFSMFSMAVSAADANEKPGKDDNIVTITFVVEGEVIETIEVMPGKPFNKYIIEGGYAELGIPTKASTETTRYIFRCWVGPDGIEGQAGNLPAVPVAKEGETQITEVTYVADFIAEDIVENQTFWAFIQTIFARINKIFEYFAKVFEGVFEF